MSKWIKAAVRAYMAACCRHPFIYPIAGALPPAWFGMRPTGSACSGTLHPPRQQDDRADDFDPPGWPELV